MCVANKVLAQESRGILVSQREPKAWEADWPSSNINTGPNADLLNDSIWIPHITHT